KVQLQGARRIVGVVHRRKLRAGLQEMLLQCCKERRGARGFVGNQITRLTRISAQVEELVLGPVSGERVLVIMDEFPIALADRTRGAVDAGGVIVRVVPVQCPGAGIGFAAEQRKQVNAVAGFVARYPCSGYSYDRLEEVSRTCQRVGGSPGVDCARPPCNQRDPNPALVELGLAAAERSLAGVLEVAAIVGCE